MLNVTKPSAFLSCGCCNQLPQTQWLKTIEIYPLAVLGARFQNQGATVPLKTLKNVPFSSNLWRLLVSLAWWLPLQSPPPSSHGLLSGSPPPLSLETLISRPRAHANNQRRSQLKSLRLIASAKTLFPNKVTFTVLWVRTWTYFWKPPLYPLHQGRKDKGCQLGPERIFPCPFPQNRDDGQVDVNSVSYA